MDVRGVWACSELGLESANTRALGGSPLLQQREATLQRCGKEPDFDHAL
jgi:hypothetical protein